jgi:hypothetical protein
MSDPAESKEQEPTSSPIKSSKLNQKLVSDIGLLLVLLLMISLVRVYVGGPQWIILVWKGEMSFKDTVVNLQDLARIPRAELTQLHPKLINQLEEMDLVEPLDLHAVKLKRFRLKKRLEREKKEEQEKKSGDQVSSDAKEISNTANKETAKQSSVPPEH